MKQITFIFLLISTFCFSQMPDISTVWLNNHQFYTGSISPSKTELKLKIELSSQDKKNDQEYYISGLSSVEKNISDFEGKIKITSYKNSKKGGKIFGNYEFFEKPDGKHTGIFQGKFIYTFKFNKKTQKIESQYLEFVGDWENYKKNLNFKTNWKN
ncbi:hypothetical protein [Frigoriflavimonas asaccharolytica]|uniref:DUF2147 domain-containing protein n=1 Tax=Frigoriflavimonas asaccharolytica TaxID=2735899 RepID=A0A8J8K8I9_9FLAO|nr:hypothetical protein [Frigoriflavimonas asaccharolytica]NRS91997.1 hypothetical protein [Frigoriflavimonas asaccharolytica]